MSPKKSVVVLDYGSGNVHSAAKALEAAGADVELTADRQKAMDADGLLVPGVGAFSAVMATLNEVRGGEPAGFAHHLIGGHFTGSMVRHVFEAIAFNAGLTMHITVVAGRDPHHIAEAEFKAFARAFRQAKAFDPLVQGIPSTKGAL